jgi:thiol-disulfide isomerase/thioredoxin
MTVPTAPHMPDRDGRRRRSRVATWVSRVRRRRIPRRSPSREVWNPLRVLGTIVLLCAVSPVAGARAAPDGSVIPTSVRSAPLATILAEAKASRAPLMLVNVWATWCDPCREELPELLRAYREHRAQGLRLVMICADDPDGRAQAAQVLASAAARAGVGRDLDATSYLKDDDDMKLIDGLDPRWSGALPATFLFDAAGQRVRSWLAPITFADVDPVIRQQLTNLGAGAKRGGAGGARGANSPHASPRRKP